MHILKMKATKQNFSYFQRFIVLGLRRINIPALYELVYNVFVHNYEVQAILSVLKQNKNIQKISRPFTINTER